MTSDDKELTYFMWRLATSKCSTGDCDFADQRHMRAVDEIRRLRTELDRVNMERATLIAINCRLADEMEELDGQMPWKFVKRWVGWLRGGWRV